MPQFTIPTPSNAPAMTWLSALWKYLSICASPESTSQSKIIPYLKKIFTINNLFLEQEMVILQQATNKVRHTRLAAALAFPCSLFLKSQFPEDPPLEASDGIVISLSCNNKNNNYNKRILKKYCQIFRLSNYLTKASIHKCINKCCRQVLPSWIHSCTCTSAAIKQMCLALENVQQKVRIKWCNTIIQQTWASKHDIGIYSFHIVSC